MATSREASMMASPTEAAMSALGNVMASANATRSSTPFAGIVPTSSADLIACLGAALSCAAKALASIQINPCGEIERTVGLPCGSTSLRVQ
jgi:hypothetical protein